MKKILELGEPISATYSHAAHTLAILANEKNNRDWLMNCFIQIFGGENDFLDYQDFGFMECPLIHTQHIGIDMVDIGWKNRLDFVKMAIINNYYIYAEMNVSKINAYEINKPFAHDALVYGFDEENKRFLISDFIGLKKYGSAWISEHELKSALYLDEGSFGKTGIFFNDYFLLKMKHDERAVFSTKKVIDTLRAYEQGIPISLGYNNRFKPLFADEKNNFLFGIQCYQLLYNMLEACSKNKKLPSRWRQVVYLFYEHKRIMVARLRFMKEKECLKNAEKYIKVYEEIRDKHEIILRLFIKYVLTSKKDILLHILLETNEAVRKEKLILSDLINDIIIRYEHL